MTAGSPAITGMGCLCAAGANLGTAWDTMMSGVSRPHSPTKFQAGIKRPSPVFEVVVPPGGTTGIHLSRDIPMTPCVYFFLLALEQALKQAGLSAADLRGKRVGVCVGTTVGCTLNDEAFYRDFKSGLKPNLAAIERFLANNPALYLNEALELRGPASTINNACSSGADAVGQASEWLSDGLCDIAIAGGTDELSRIPYLGFSSLLNTSSSPCRPFDAKRDGLNLGEGAGVLILEPKTSADKRGVQILAEIAGYGACTDAFHPTKPHPQGVGLERAIRRALGSIDPADICFINAHGTATAANDEVEGSTFARIFGKDVTVFGTKSYTGHTLGAAGAIEAIFTAMGLITGKIPPTAGFSEPDPACVITPTTEITEIKGNRALSTSLAFGGHNSALLIKGASHAG
jgi:3-oxoacyl-[acyl-carrier-protein] synthase-1/3-oxoacyl-[acyl-carrier-protein] synthase II